MKPLYFCGAVFCAMGVLNGSVLNTGTDLNRGYSEDYASNLGYSPHGLSLGTSGLVYGSPGYSYGTLRPPDATSISIGFATNGLHYGTNYGPIYEEPCHYRFTNEVVSDYRVRVLKFMTPLFKRAAVLSGGHFALSLYTIWLTLAAVAEATDGSTRQELFSLLNLPEDRCLRQYFYQLCATRENPSNVVVFVRNRFFITDSSVHVNRNWETFALTQTHLNTISVPFKHNPFREIEVLKRIFNVQLPNLNLNGNSFFLETLDYRGLWTSAFSDAIIETGPFYSSFGEPIGTVEYMKIRQRVKAAYVRTSNMKVIEFPVGENERYTMLFAIFLGNEKSNKNLDTVKHTTLFEFLETVKVTPVPIDIVIPKLTMTSEMDVRQIIEDIGIKALWTDPSLTRNISYPAALPSSYMQRVSLVIDNIGLQPPSHEYPIVQDLYRGYSIHGVSQIPDTQSPRRYRPPNNVPTKYPFEDVSEIPDTDLLKDFVANRPFMFALLDSETYTCLFTGGFSKPENYI